MSRIIHVAVFLFCINSIGCFAQDKTKAYSKISAYGEIAGMGGMYSLNLDYRVKENIAIRVGFTKWSMDLFFIRIDDFTGFPIGVNYLTGGQHKGEFGLCSILAVADGELNFLFFDGEFHDFFLTYTYLNIGYRYQPKLSGLMFRATLYPGGIATGNSKVEVSPSLLFGVSLGYSF